MYLKRKADQMTEQSPDSMGLHPRGETDPLHEATPPAHGDAAAAPTTTAVSEPLFDEALNDPTLPRVPGTTAAAAPKP